MKARRLKAFLVTGALGGLCALLTTVTAADSDSRSPARAGTPDKTPEPGSRRLACFTLTDQFGATNTVTFPRAKPTVLVVADRKGSEEVEGWVGPLHAKFQNRVELLGLADVSKVPGFLRGRVRGAFRVKFPHAVLLDWKGEQCRALDYPRGRVAVYVLDGVGTVRFSTTGKADAAGLAAVTGAASKLVDAASQQAAAQPTPSPAIR